MIHHSRRVRDAFCVFEAPLCASPGANLTHFLLRKKSRLCNLRVKDQTTFPGQGLDLRLRLDSGLDSTPLDEEHEEHGKGTMAHWIKCYAIETQRQLSAEMATDQERLLADPKLDNFSREGKEYAKKPGKNAKQQQLVLSASICSSSQIELIRAFEDPTGSERGFILVNTEIVSYSGLVVKATNDCINAAMSGDVPAFENSLADLLYILAAYQKINKSMETMWSRSEKEDYLNFRSFIFGTAPKASVWFLEGSCECSF